MDKGGEWEEGGISGCRERSWSGKRGFVRGVEEEISVDFRGVVGILPVYKGSLRSRFGGVAQW